MIGVENLFSSRSDIGDDDELHWAYFSCITGAPLTSLMGTIITSMLQFIPIRSNLRLIL